MTNSIYKKFLASTGAIMTGAALSATPATEAHVKLNEPRTVIAPGKEPQEQEDGKVSFIVDASKIGNMDYLFSRRIAVIFEGHAAPDRQCPYIAMNDRTPVYKAIQHRVFRVETPASAKEIETVKTKGCLVTDSPPISSVLGASPH